MHGLNLLLWRFHNTSTCNQVYQEFPEALPSAHAGFHAAYKIIQGDGERIKEEQMEHIWDSFYTTSQKKKPVTSENEVRNIGLGLFVVRKIVNKHKGSCGVQNMENGVLFWFQLPEIRDLGK